MPLFEHGRLLTTPAALDFCIEHNISVIDLLTRHFQGDWGDCSASDKRANQEALKSGERIWSVYKFKDDKIYIITEATGDDGKRAATTIMLSGDY